MFSAGCSERLRRDRDGRGRRRKVTSQRLDGKLTGVQSPGVLWRIVRLDALERRPDLRKLDGLEQRVDRGLNGLEQGINLRSLDGLEQGIDLRSLDALERRVLRRELGDLVRAQLVLVGGADEPPP